MIKPAVLCHAGHRDLYQVAWALREAGLLETLVTDLYFDPARIPLLRGLARARPKLGVYSCCGLAPKDVYVPWSAALRALVLKRWCSRERQIVHDREIGRTARRLAEKTGAALFSYSYYAASAFEPGGGLPANRILFQLHPHPASARKLLQEEFERVPEAAVSLNWEHEIGSREEHFESLCREPLLANAWIAASSFTAQTLSENGIPRNQIHVVPYGVDSTEFPARQTPPPPGRPLRLIWVGNLVQRKGLTYLLDAVAQFSAREVELVMCTHNPVDAGLVRQRNLANVQVLVGLSNAELVKQLHQSDLFVLPSLAEGFGHVILEAMSSGVPALTTVATCAPDLLQDGVHGFIIPIRDSAAIAARIGWGMQHRSELYQIGLAAAAQARTFTWERFRKGIVTAYSAMVQNGGGDKAQCRPCAVTLPAVPIAIHD